jgi:quercetin dioxygenase-like cupin family protein
VDQPDEIFSAGDFFFAPPGTVSRRGEAAWPAA